MAEKQELHCWYLEQAVDAIWELKMLPPVRRSFANWQLFYQADMTEA